jgi:hypothetical protein
VGWWKIYDFFLEPPLCRKLRFYHTHVSTPCFSIKKTKDEVDNQKMCCVTKIIILMKEFIFCIGKENFYFLKFKIKSIRFLPILKKQDNFKNISKYNNFIT